jgi:hypothetical protein
VDGAVLSELGKQLGVIRRQTLWYARPVVFSSPSKDPARTSLPMTEIDEETDPESGSGHRFRNSSEDSEQ